MFSESGLPPAPIDRAIKRLAHAGIWLCGALLLLGAGALLWQLGDRQRFAEWSARLMPGMPTTITTTSWAAGAATVTLVYLIACWALAETIALFRAFAAGDRFGAMIERRLYRLGWAVMVLAIGTVIGRTILALSITWLNPPGQRQLLLQFHGADAAGLIIGVLLLLLAKLMLLAKLADEERRGFV